MKRKTLLLSILLGLAFDILFWKKSQGISFLIFITILLLFGYYLLRQLSVDGDKKGLYFLIPISVFTVFSFIYNEPFVTFLNRWITILLIGILGVGYQSGLWPQLGLVDYLSRAVGLFGQMISVPWLRSNQIAIFDEGEPNQKDKGKIKPIIRGLLIALPIIILFAALFASADLVFESSLQNLFSYFEIDNLGEILVRLFIVFIISNFFLGLITYIVLYSKDKKLIGKNKPIFPPFLGMIETAIILSSLLLLFITFLIVQFRYFFFNQEAILDMGFTYAEYARKGFGELIAVSIFSLGIILILNTITEKLDKIQKRIFSSLNIALVACNLVVLVSSFMRLYLYESAYGFTRLRAYSHVLIIWLGILLISVAVLAWKNRIRLSTNIAIICMLGFGISLNILNVDAFIVRKNIEYVQADHPLDSPYLASLSTDALPEMVTAFQDENTPQDTKTDIGTALACFNAFNHEKLVDMEWQSFTISNMRAVQFLDSIGPALDTYKVEKGDWETTIVDPDGKTTTCYPMDFPF